MRFRCRRETPGEDHLRRIGLHRQRRRDLSGGEGIGGGVAGEGEAAVAVLGGDELGERRVAAGCPSGSVRVLAGGEQRLEDERGGIGVGARAGLVGEAAARQVLLGVQPGERGTIPAVHPGGVQGHEHHGRGVGVAGVEAGVVLDELEVPAAVAVLGGDEMAEGRRRDRLMGGDQPLDGEGLRECLTVAEDAGAGRVEAVEGGEQVDAPEGGGVEPGGGDRLEELTTRPGGGAGGGGVGSEIGHDRGAGAVAQRVGVVTGGGRPDRVLLADRVRARPHRDRSVTPRLLPLQVFDRPRQGIDLRGRAAGSNGEGEQRCARRSSGRQCGDPPGPAHVGTPRGEGNSTLAGVVLAA